MLLEAIDNNNYQYLDNYIRKLLYLRSINSPEFKNNYINNILNNKSVELKIFNKHFNDTKYKLFYHLYKIIQTGKSNDKKAIYDVLNIKHEFYQSWTYYFLGHIQKNRLEKIKYFKLATQYNYQVKYFAYWQLGKMLKNKYYLKKLVNKKIVTPVAYLIDIYVEENKRNKIRYYSKLLKKMRILYKIANNIQNYDVCYYILRKKMKRKICIPSFLLYIILKK